MSLFLKLYFQFRSQEYLIAVEYRQEQNGLIACNSAAQLKNRGDGGVVAVVLALHV